MLTYSESSVNVDFDNRRRHVSLDGERNLQVGRFPHRQFVFVGRPTGLYLRSEKRLCLDLRGEHFSDGQAAD
mgnify:CR=1 FL=1